MYRLIFYFFYRYFTWRNDSSPKFGAICGVFLTIGMHCILLFVVIQKWAGRRLLPSFSDSYTLSKLYYMLVAVPFLLLTIQFFNKERSNRIIEAFENKANAFSFLNWTIFLLAFLSPFVLLPILLRK